MKKSLFSGIVLAIFLFAGGCGDNSNDAGYYGPPTAILTGTWEGTYIIKYRDDSPLEEYTAVLEITSQNFTYIKGTLKMYEAEPVPVEGSIDGVMIIIHTPDFTLNGYLVEDRKRIIFEAVLGTQSTKAYDIKFNLVKAT